MRNEAVSDFDWSKCENQNSRLKKNRELYRHVTVESMFGLTEKEGFSKGPVVPMVGSILRGRVLDVKPKVIEIEIPNSKMSVHCRDSVKVALGQDVQFVIVNVTNDSTLVSIVDVCRQSFIENINNSTIIVENLELTKGGYMCKTRITSLVEEYGVIEYIDCFVPGSQIVLNIERNHSAWIGSSIECVVTNILYKNGVPTLVCSRKKLLQDYGKVFIKNKIAPDFKSDPMKLYSGQVTGKLNNDDTCGYFVEMDTRCNVGILKVEKADIHKYVNGDIIEGMKIDTLDERSGRITFKL